MTSRDGLVRLASIGTFKTRRGRHDEAVASAMMSPGDVFADATSDGEAVTVVVTSADGWSSPDDDLGGSRMSIVREIVENVSFEQGSGKPRLSFQKRL